jgi:predicted RND superfamily exporter protein
MSLAMSETLLGTLTAMAAASIAYGALLVTSFRGFNQFGLMGGAGMLLVWVMSFAMVPPLVILGERIKSGILTPKRNLWRVPFGFVGRLAQRYPGILALLTLIGLGLAAKPLIKYVDDPLEWDFNNLRSDDIPGKQTASQRLWSRMEWIGLGDMSAGYIANYGILLVDEPEQANPVAEALRKKDLANGHMLSAIRTLDDFLPKDADAKLEILKRIRSKIDKHTSMLDDDEKKEVLQWRPPDNLKNITRADLPKIVKEAYTETDGHIGRLIGIDADHQHYSDWNGHDSLKFAKALRVDALGKTWMAASQATVFSGMLETIIADGPRVTLTALVGVCLLVLVAFGFSGATPVLTSLAIGIIWLGGCLGMIGLKINFMNFVGLPITLGVGADYAANIWARLRHEGPERISQVIADTGSAVALCSCTTIIGYSSLLMSRNRALRSFGLLADIGEVTCLLAALVALPALVSFVRRSRNGNTKKKAELA